MPSPLLLRSILFVPASRPDRFAKAFASGADGVILDLEDAVEDSRKDESRTKVGEWLASNPAASSPGVARFVRVNAPGSEWQDADLAWLTTISDWIDGAVLPKATSAADLERVADAAPARRVIPLFESARAVLHAEEILAASADVPAVLFGAEDFTAELGIPRTLDGDELIHARSQIVLACAAAGAEAIDAVWVDIKNAESLRRDAERARALGFRGKLAIHPDQVSVINDVFTPSAAEIGAATRLIEAEAAAKVRGDGAFRFEDRMVDAPVVKRARRVLEIAARVTNPRT